MSVVIETEERFGHPFRHFKAAVSVEAMALAWARQEDAPQGATVLADREISPIGRRSRLWTVAPESTLACAVVLRPELAVDDADAVWLVVAAAAAEGAEEAGGRTIGITWPDEIVDTATEQMVGTVKAEAQLGPGQVRSAVITMRFDLDALGLDATRRDDLLEAVLRGVDSASAGLGDGVEAVAAAYERRCTQIGRRVKIRLMPKGETRGVAERVDRKARLELESATGMVERISIDMLRELKVV